MEIRRVIVFLLIIILLGVLSAYYPKFTGEGVNNSNNNYQKESCLVSRIIDGDTLVCDNVTIRLLGINTPEKGEAFSEEATAFLRQVEGKEVEVLRDWDDEGKYYRKLRYIFYEDRMINMEIVENGLAIAFMTEKLKYEDKFLNAEKFAKSNCLGIWKEGC